MLTPRRLLGTIRSKLVPSLEARRLAVALVIGGALPVALVAACADERERVPPVGGGLAGGPGIPEPCRTPAEGCECEEDGIELDCGRLTETFGDYVTCQMGTRTCVDGAWSACTGDRVTIKSAPTSTTPGLRPRTPGTPEECTDPCDPYCVVTPETPDLVDAGPNFTNDGGLTIVQTGGDAAVACSSLELTPSTDTVTVTEFGPPIVTSPSGAVTFTLDALPVGCATTPFPTTWVVDAVDRATISGTDNTNGQLTLAVPVAGPVVVTAYAEGLNASATITYRVNVVEAPTSDGAASPNDAASSSSPYSPINAFSTVSGACAPTVTDNCRNSPHPGSVASSVNWLYPYANTYFPLGLQAPWIQYLYTTDGNGEVKVSLRYPTGLTATDADTLFNYSLIVEEQNTAAETYAGVTSTYLDPQVIIPETAWQYFEQTARGNDADLVIQRRRGTANTVEFENARTIHFVDGQLKGTVFYNTYNSRLAGAGNTGAILKINPGAATPTLAVQPSGRCTVCHTVNLDGSSLITNTLAGPTGWQFNESRRYNITTAGPSPTIQNSYSGSDGPIPALGLSTVVTQTGGGPLVTITGTSADDAVSRITITTGGARGTARFAWDYGGRTGTQTGTNVLTAAAVTLGTTGLTANFAAGTYVLGTTYEWRSAASSGSRAGEYYAHILGNRYTFGAPWTDGSLYMTHGGRPTGSAGQGDPNFRAPPDYSNLFRVTPDTARSTPLAVTGWPANMLAVTPRFSTDGTKLAFGFWGGDTLPQSPSGNLAHVARGTRIAVVDFTCSSPPCTGSSSGWTVSNARDVTPGVTHRVANPSFTPSGDAVVYQRQYRTSKSRTERDIVQSGSGPAITISNTPTTDGNGLITITTGGARGTARFSWSYGASSGTNVLTAATVNIAAGQTINFPTGTYVVGTTYSWEVGVIGGPGWGQWAGWSPSHVNTSAGALAEIWMSNVPADASTAATPTRLFALNGLSSGGVNYLPTASRLVTPAQNTYHAANASFTIAQADLCSNTGTATNVNDYQLNYLPAVNPTTAGGFRWVVFTSRRMFGNIAYHNPWDTESTTSCDSGVPPTKKLWVAAIDPSFTPGTDPSHPAFYLPGQELSAGNSNGYWVNSACGDVGASCSSHDDCCLATGDTPTRECRITAVSPLTRQCQNISSCSDIGAACTTTADCCSGECPAGGGVCFVPPVITPPTFTTQTLTREFVADCPHGTQPVWRFFEWQATIPADTSIDFFVQTKDAAGDSYEPAMPALLSSADEFNTTSPTTWYRGPDTVDEVLADQSPALASGNYLLVTMTFNPTDDEAPVLHQWRQIFDCMPAE